MSTHENSLKNLEAGRQVFSDTNRPPGLGRPPGSLSRSTVFKNWMGARVTTQDINGTTVTLTVEDAIVIAQARKAIEKGDTMAAMFLFEGKYGKVKDVVGEGSANKQIDYSQFTPEQLQIIKQAQALLAANINNQRNKDVEDAEVIG